MLELERLRVMEGKEEVHNLKGIVSPTLIHLMIFILSIHIEDIP